jgi:hypothetical protein
MARPFPPRGIREARLARSARLVAVAEVVEPAKRPRGILPVGDRERIESALAEEVELVALHVADGAELPGVVIALAQEPRVRVAAPIGELRKVDRDQRQPGDVGCERLRVLVGREPYARFAARDQRRAPGEPQR